METTQDLLDMAKLLATQVVDHGNDTVFLELTENKIKVANMLATIAIAQELKRANDLAEAESDAAFNQQLWKVG